MISALDLKEQYESIKGEIDTAVAEVLESTQFVLGSAVRDLEEQVAAYCGCRYGGVGVASGADALRLTLAALGIGPGGRQVAHLFGPYGGWPAFLFIWTCGRSTSYRGWSYLREFSEVVGCTETSQ